MSANRTVRTAKACSAHLRIRLRPKDRTIKPTPFKSVKPPNPKNVPLFPKPPINRRGAVTKRLPIPSNNISQAIIITRIGAFGFVFSVSDEAGEFVG